jgi:hypothetical protein
MVFPIAGGTQSTGYDISNSLKFNDDDSSLLSRTPGTTATDRKKATISFWFKIGNITDSFRSLYRFNDGSGTGAVYLRSGNDLQFAWEASSSNIDVRPDGVFRDPTAWYHAFIRFDTTQSTAADRVEIYINGVERTYSTANYPNQNDTVNHLTTDKTYYIGGDGQSSDKYFDGYIAEFNVVDGQAKSHLDFGEFDDNGVWIPKKYTGTYGNNGFHLEFKETGTSANSSGIGADTSGNDKHFTVTNLAATDVTTDTCTNNFCTMNPLYTYTGITLSEGNLQTNLGGSNHRWGTGTFFVEAGKWYFECKVLSDNNLNSGPGVIAYGIDDPLTTEGGGAGSKAEGWIYLSTSAGDLQHGGTQYGTASAATTNDILMVAFDVDNGKIWIGKNGTWSEGSNPSTGNGAVRSDLGDATSGLFAPGISGYNENFVFNFGSPPFSISSGNADANGHGNFEYAVPSGYFALCTKNLAETG